MEKGLKTSVCPTEVNFTVKVSKLMVAEKWLQERKKQCIYAQDDTRNFSYVFNSGVNNSGSGIKLRLICKRGQELDLGDINEK